MDRHPGMLNDAPLPEGRDLPLAIKALPRHHVARVRQTTLDADVEDLIARLDEIGSHPPTDEPVSEPEFEVTPRVAPEEGRGEAIFEVPAADDEHYQMLVDEPTTWSSSSAQGPTRTTARAHSSPGPRCFPTTPTSRSTLRSRPG
jgi:hypothetical protein